MKNEPILTAGFIVSFVSAVILLITEFGVALTPGQQSAIMGLVALVAPVIVGVVGRYFVDGPETRRRKERRRFGH